MVMLETDHSQMSLTGYNGTVWPVIRRFLTQRSSTEGLASRRAGMWCSRSTGVKVARSAVLCYDVCGDPCGRVWMRMFVRAKLWWNREIGRGVCDRSWGSRC